MSSQPRRRRLEVEDIGDVTVINFVDRKILDEQNIQIIGEQLFGLVDQDGRRKLLLNFGNVEYLSSAALGKLITLNKKLQQAGGRLVLCNIDPQIHEVFEITKLDKFFKIYRSEQTALRYFLPGGSDKNSAPEDTVSPRAGSKRSNGAFVSVHPWPSTPSGRTSYQWTPVSGSTFAVFGSMTGSAANGAAGRTRSASAAIRVMVEWGGEGE